MHDSLVPVAGNATGCFTGAVLFELIRRRVDVTEADILLFGRGFSLRSGVDGDSLPCCDYPVIASCLEATGRIGIEVKELRVGESELLGLAAEAGSHGSPLILWVNSSFLTHHFSYRANAAFLHCLVCEFVEGSPICSAIDPYIHGPQPGALRFNISWSTLSRASLTRIPGNEGASELGLAYYLRFPESESAKLNFRGFARDAALYAQRRAVLSIPDEIEKFWLTIKRTIIERPGDQDKILRRSAQIIYALHVVPLLRTLHFEVGALSLCDVRSVVDVWREVSLMMLKCAATGSFESRLPEMETTYMCGVREVGNFVNSIAICR
jgi:hypothetical protein